MFDIRFNMIPQTFIIVGCGGTGSRLVPLIAQFVKACPWIISPSIFLVDDDVVEKKNLLRQNFIAQDVGKPKAEVLANRYSRAFDVPILPLVRKVTEGGGIINFIYGGNKEDKLLFGNLNATIVISCVDSMKARRHILSEFGSVWQRNAIFLDGGNEDIFGQVMVSTPKHMLLRRTSKSATFESTAHSELQLPVPVKATVGYAPCDWEFYATTQEGTSERSCADLDQTMAINTLIANVMFGVLQNILYSKPLIASRYNVSLGGVFPEVMTLRYMWDKANLRSTNSSYSDNYYKLFFDRSEDGATNKDFVSLTHSLEYFDWSSHYQSLLSIKLSEYKAERERERQAKLKQEIEKPPAKKRTRKPVAEVITEPEELFDEDFDEDN